MSDMIQLCSDLVCDTDIADTGVLLMLGLAQSQEYYEAQLVWSHSCEVWKDCKCLFGGATTSDK